MKTLGVGAIFMAMSVVLILIVSTVNCDKLTQNDWKQSDYSKVSFDYYIKSCHDSIKITGVASLIFLGIAGIIISLQLLRLIASGKIYDMWHQSCAKCGKEFGLKGFVWIPEPSWNCGFKELCKECYNKVKGDHLA